MRCSRATPSRRTSSATADPLMPTCCCAATTPSKSPRTPRSSTARGRICGPSPRRRARRMRSTRTSCAVTGSADPNWIRSTPQPCWSELRQRIQGSGHRAARPTWPGRTACWRTTAFTSSWSTHGCGSSTATRRPRCRCLQDCRIRWGTVESVEDEHAVIATRPLTFADGTLALGEPQTERVRWRKDGVSLIAPPAPGDVVSAHWDWACGDSHRRPSVPRWPTRRRPRSIWSTPPAKRGATDQ